jgi:hypothetical protein
MPGWKAASAAFFVCAPVLSFPSFRDFLDALTIFAIERSVMLLAEWPSARR